MTIGTKYKRFIIAFFLFCGILTLYRYSPYKIEFIGHYNKIWAHRVNSLEKLEEALIFYKGVELDLVYLEDTDVFDVNHPPSKSIGLTFEKYLSEITEDQKTFLWLDLKNLTKENSDAILKKLLILFNQRNYALKNILIETRYPEALPVFTKKGFMTSYYLPYDLYKKNRIDLEAELVKIKKTLDSQLNIGISTSYENYKIISDEFPNKTKYIWAINHSKFKDFTLIRQLLNDETVKVVLTRFKAFQGNR